MYAHQKGYPGKADRVTRETMLCSQAVLLLSGYSRLPSMKMYWEECPDTYSYLVTENIRRDTFEAVLWCTHFTDNDLLDPRDKFAKVRPLFTQLNTTAKEYLPISQTLCVDEMMVPYFGPHSCKQYIRGKPIRYGYKIWGLCSSKGWTIHLEPYCGSSTQLDKFNMGQGPDVVMGLVVKADPSPGSRIYFDNLFTSVPLLECLSERGLGGTGTVTQARMKAIPLPNRKDVEKQWDRGQYTMVYHKDIVAVVWKDNKGVCLMSNIHEVEPPHQVKRWSKQEHKYTHVTMPALIDDYNCNMGGVDMIDKMVGAYRIRYSNITIQYGTIRYNMVQYCTV